jgi:bla regulator protein BlaR1
MANHLWQSTIFAAGTALLALALRNHQARVRHWLWMAASLKFLVPFSLLAELGSRLGTHVLPAAVAPRITVAIDVVSRPFESPAHATTGTTLLPPVLAIVWLCGSVALAFIWGVRWWRVRADVRRARPLQEGRECEALRRLGGESVRLVASDASMEPGVFGIVRPVLMLPESIGSRLDGDQLDTILAHELCHVKGRPGFQWYGSRRATAIIPPA